MAQLISLRARLASAYGATSFKEHLDIRKAEKTAEKSTSEVELEKVTRTAMRFPKYDRVHILTLVAGNAHTGRDTLNRMANVCMDHIEQTPVTTQTLLSISMHYTILKTMMPNPGLPKETQIRIATSDEKGLQFEMLKNPALTTEAAFLLENSSAIEVHEAAQKRFKEIFNAIFRSNDVETLLKELRKL
jgi:hypothetical protein